jgi:hypothetical protein
LAEVRAVKAFARACGGVPQALEVLEAWPGEMTLERVHEYLTLFTDD